MTLHKVAIPFFIDYTTKRLNIYTMKKLIYIAPEVEVLNIQIEQGFAATGETDDLPGFGNGGSF